MLTFLFPENCTLSFTDYTIHIPETHLETELSYDHEISSPVVEMNHHLHVSRQMRNDEAFEYDID